MTEPKPPELLIDPWGAVLVEDYRRIMEQFGLEPFTDDLLKRLPKPNRLMRRKVVFCHRDLGSIVRAVEAGEPFYALTGFVPSAERLHLGSKLVVENMRYFQELGAKTFVLVADLEAAAVRGISLETSRRWALDFYIPAYLALGMDPRRTIFYFQSENREVVRLASVFSHKITMRELEAIYGALDPGKVIACLLDAADILYPQLEGRIPGVIPVGIDQDPHIRLTRDLVERTKREFAFVRPASVYHKFTPSLDGSLKMSKSKPGSYVEIPEDPTSVERKIWNAFTGGWETAEKQRKLGGRPERCMVFELFKQHLVEEDSKLDEIFQSCKAGSLLCGDCKSLASELMSKFMADFEEKLEKARELVPELTFVR